jgi:Ca2+-binding RTX toxin-like protein
MGNGITSSIQTVSYYDVSDVGDSPASWLLGGVKWGDTVGAGVNLTYSFGNANSSYDDYSYGSEPDVGYEEMSAAEKANALAAMKSYANVAEIVFTQVADTATSAGDIRWANTTLDPGSYAWAAFPGSNAMDGDIWNNPDIATPFQNEQFYVFAHELGHALGLSHPHAEEDRLTPAAPSGRDSVKYTLMSYNDYVGDTSYADESAYYPTTLMMDDIRTVQALYGKNMAYGAGNTTYQWAAGSVIYETIWDGGGIDTINAANQSSGVSINLNPGTFSTIGKAFNNGQQLVRDCLAIAYECDIENATGSAFNDTLKGNALANQLSAGTGNDILDGAAGNDSLNGGAGIDSMTGGNGSDSYYVDNAADQVIETSTTGGTDIVYSYLSAYTLGDNVENGRILATGTASLTGNSLNNVLYAGAGNNALEGSYGVDTASYQYVSAAVSVSLATTAAQATGGSGSDSLRFIENLTGSSYADSLTGSTGNNSLSGLGGNDILAGGLGADKLTGGTGADRFDFNALAEMGLSSTTWDTITDFKTSEADKIDLLGVDANTALTGNQAFTFLGTAAFTGDATGKLRFDATAHILYGSTDADTAAEFAIVLTGVNSLAGTDLVL